MTHKTEEEIIKLLNTLFAENLGNQIWAKEIRMLFEMLEKSKSYDS